MSYDKPFAGLKVVDVSQGVAGPYCAMLLAQYGANVIKVEPPGVGDWAAIWAWSTATSAPIRCRPTWASAASPWI